MNSVFLDGKSIPSSQPQVLHVGKMTVLLEDGGLRYIRYAGQEVLRGIYSAVRDQNWGTVMPVFSNQTLQQEDSFLKLEFTATYQKNEIDFRAVYGLEVSEDYLKFSFSGQAHNSFYKNRLGFCVLHPMSAAGAMCRLEHVDGSQEEAALPTRAIATQPVLPFAELKALQHQVAPDLWARLEFEGEVFEMEDQRNWTDASFKTFCTPLGLPFPVLIEKGHEITQSITLYIRSSTPATLAQAATAANTLTLGLARFRLPQIGTEMASHAQPLSELELKRLHGLNLAHLRVELDLAGSFEAKLQQAIKQSQILNLPLEVAFTVAEPIGEKLENLSRALEKLEARICRFLIYPAKARTSQHSSYLEAARDLLSGFSVPIFGGTNSDFYFLNGYPVSPQAVDGLTFGLHPQTHAFDNASLLETLEAQTFVAKEAKRLSAGKPVMVSPVTFKPRWNPYATSASAPTLVGELPAQVDPRQLSLFGAAWTLGCLKALSASNSLEAITFFETSGWRGLMETEAGSALPEKFPSSAGGVFPLFHIFADVAEFVGGQVVEVRSSHPLHFDGLMLQKDGRSCLLLANYTGEKQLVELEEFPQITWLRKLRDHTVMGAMGEPEKWRQSLTQPHAGAIELPPFAYVRLEFASEGVRA